MAIALHQLSVLHPNQVRRWLALLMGLSFAVYLGHLIATSQQRYIILIAASILGVVLILGLQRHIWVLILMFWSMTGGSAIMPVPINIREATIILAAVAYVAYKIVSHNQTKHVWSGLDWLVLAVLGMVLLTYVRNPIGLRIAGSETIGARHYFGVFLAFAAWWVIIRLPHSTRLVRWFPFFGLVGTGSLALLYGGAYFFPSLPARVPIVYASLDVNAYFATGVQEWDVPRYQQLAPVGISLMTILCARYLPRTLFHPLRVRSYALLFAVGCILASGFRSAFIYVIPYFGFGSLLRRGWREFLLMTLIGGLVLGGVLAGQGRVFTLPLTAQRALSFLPGNWSPLAAGEGESSTKSRFTWWKQLLDDGHFRNYWLGDGWGISQKDFMAHYLRSDSDTFEYFTLTGAYHNGPLTTVRVVGVIGLVAYYALMIAAAVQAVRCVQRCRGTPLEFPAIFLAIWFLWRPIHFTFIFGSFDSDLPQVLLYVAMLRVVTQLSPARELADLAPVANGAPGRPKANRPWGRVHPESVTS